MSDTVASEEDPFVWDIARIKRDGELSGLRHAVRVRMNYFKDQAWNNVERGSTYQNLGEAIKRAEHELKEMRMLLDALVQIDPNNS